RLYEAIPPRGSWPSCAASERIGSCSTWAVTMRGLPATQLGGADAQHMPFRELRHGSRRARYGAPRMRGVSEYLRVAKPGDDGIFAGVEAA
ncbi:MAG: hypothetical protein DRJ67_09790, partial [Thermoprotei archaeon]